MRNKNTAKELADGAWLTKPEALALLKQSGRAGTSERSLDRMVNSGKVERRTRPQGQGKPPQAIFSRADMERESAVEAFPMPAPENGNGNGKHVATVGARTDSLVVVAQMLAAMMAQAQALAPAPRQLPAPALWLSLDAAAEYSGLSARLLRKLIRTDCLPAVRDAQAWKIRREDIERLRVTGATRPTGIQVDVNPVHDSPGVSEPTAGANGKTMARRAS
jgi:hypothetical protein